jgi:hypothetical protein
MGAAAESTVAVGRGARLAATTGRPVTTEERDRFVALNERNTRDNGLARANPQTTTFGLARIATVAARAVGPKPRAAQTTVPGEATASVVALETRGTPDGHGAVGRPDTSTVGQTTGAAVTTSAAVASHATSRQSASPAVLGVATASVVAIHFRATVDGYIAAGCRNTTADTRATSATRAAGTRERATDTARRANSADATLGVVLIHERAATDGHGPGAREDTTADAAAALTGLPTGSASPR